MLWIGTKFKPVCVPFKYPFPNNPPEPIAILDCVMFQPDPNGSILGLISVSILCFCFGVKILFKTNPCPFITKIDRTNKITALTTLLIFLIDIHLDSNNYFYLYIYTYIFTYIYI